MRVKLEPESRGWPEDSDSTIAVYVQQMHHWGPVDEISTSGVWCWAQLYGLYGRQQLFCLSLSKTSGN